MNGHADEYQYGIWSRLGAWLATDRAWALIGKALTVCTLLGSLAYGAWSAYWWQRWVNERVFYHQQTDAWMRDALKGPDGKLYNVNRSVILDAIVQERLRQVSQAQQRQSSPVVQTPVKK